MDHCWIDEWLVDTNEAWIYVNGVGWLNARLDDDNNNNNIELV
jgi:hypothetical protein